MDSSDLKVKQVQCKSIISKSGIYGVDYSINPYTGCEHACLYCYARFMLRFRKEPGIWGQFVDVKINSPKVLSKQVRKTKPGSILISSVTDPYQPQERTHRLTRRILQRLSETSFQVMILTKSALVERDLDIFVKNPSWEVGMTLVTNDEKVRRIFEPGASPIEERIQALENISEAGVPTYVFLGPLLPYISEKGLPKLLERVSQAGVKYLLIDRLNIKSGNWGLISRAFRQNFPEIPLDKVREVCFGTSDYFHILRKRIDQEAISLGLECNFVF